MSETEDLTEAEMEPTHTTTNHELQGEAMAAAGVPPRGLRRMRPGGRLGALVLLLVVPIAACTTTPTGSPASEAIPPDDLLAGTALGLGKPAHEPIPESQVLALSPEMHAFLDAHVGHRGNDPATLRQLIYSMVESQKFKLGYDDITRTASETFHDRHGNCLSFSLLFFAMARAAGLSVHFQEVSVPPDWTLDKDTYVLNQHVNVFVDLNLAGTRVVDFNIGDFRSSFEMRKISDLRALAHYYNNVGVAYMQEGDAATALAYFRRALGDNDREFSPSWTNLGTLYLRQGHPAHAEAAYLKALEADDTDLVAMSNLARLYDKEGDRERAAEYEKKVASHRFLNPYYRYQLAQQAYEAGDYSAAIGHLKYAVRKRPKEDRFCFLLGMSYMKSGDEKAGKRWLEKAQELAATDAQKRRYSFKVDTMLKPGGGS
jgi:Flp pilus assembly protein TadD